MAIHLPVIVLHDTSMSGLLHWCLAKMPQVNEPEVNYIIFIFIKERFKFTVCIVLDLWISPI